MKCQLWMHYITLPLLHCYPPTSIKPTSTDHILHYEGMRAKRNNNIGEIMNKVNSLVDVDQVRFKIFTFYTSQHPISLSYILQFLSLIFI